jgi:altronate dehydratase large subunit
MQFWGYERGDGSVGVRNYVAIVSAGIATHNMAIQISRGAHGSIPLLPDDTSLRLQEDRARALRTIIGLGMNPNIAALLLIGHGGEHFNLHEVREQIAPSNKPVEVVTLLDSQGYANAMEKGLQVVRSMSSQASQQQRQLFDMGHLTLGVKCGGSHANSGVLGNAVTGRVLDQLIAEGGRAIFSETTEMIGATHLLAKRAIHRDVAKRLYEVVGRMEARIKATGQDIRGSQPTASNIRGGLSTLEEKSLGALAKTGTSPLQGVLEYSESPTGKGLFFMDGTASTLSVMAAEAAAGAQIFIFSLGGGLTSSFRSLPGWWGCGLPILPTLSIVSNPSQPRDEKEKEFFDVHCDTIVEGKESVDQVADRLLHEVIAVASGKLTRLEISSPQDWVPLEMYPTGPLL